VHPESKNIFIEDCILYTNGGKTLYQCLNEKESVKIPSRAVGEWKIPLAARLFCVIAGRGRRKNVCVLFDDSIVPHYNSGMEKVPDIRNHTSKILTNGKGAHGVHYKKRHQSNQHTLSVLT